MTRRPLAALVLALVAAACTRQAVAETCPYAQPFLGCVLNVGWKLPNLTQVLISKKATPLITVPPLNVVGYPGDPNLLAILPLNGAVDLLFNSIPQSTHNCFVPVLPGLTAKRWAADPDSPYYSSFKACSRAPWPDGSEHTFVMGAWGDLSKISKKRLRQVPAVAQFKRKYGKMAPKLGLCMGVNPCGMNIFIGLERFEQYATMNFDFNNGAKLKVFVRPDSYYWSWGMSMLPPAWRAPGAPPMAWGIDPLVNGSLGWSSPIQQLSGTTLTGSVYVEGPLRGGSASNNLKMSFITFELGSQKAWWGMLRDLTRRAVSMKLHAMPNVLLWNKVALSFRDYDRYIHIRGAQLTARTSDGFFWASAYRQNIPAYNLARFITPLGNLLAKVYVGAKTGTTHRITSFEMHGHGSSGAAVRLWFKPGNFKLTPAARFIVGIPTIWTDWAAIFRAPKDSNFYNSVTLSLGGRPYQIVFCSRASDCASSAGCWTHCHDKLRVCVPRDPAPDGCPGTLRMGAASAATAAAVAAAAAQLPEVPASSPDPLSGEGEVAMAVAEAGRECSWDNPCPRGRCESDYLQERYVCVDP